MTFTSLLLPIALSAVAAFLASFVLHMALPWHRNDYRSVPDEAAATNALRPLAIPPGDYMVPRPADPAEMRSPGFAARVKEGPNIIMTVLPNGPWTMGRNLGLWFAYLVVIISIAACIACSLLGAGARPSVVFHLIAAVSFLGFAGALWQMSIWWRRSWMTTIRATVDGAIYAAIAGGIFAWLWPH